MSYLKHPPPVNMMRITGRPAHPGQALPPWGYGDDFDEGALPPALKVGRPPALAGPPAERRLCMEVTPPP